MKRISFLFKLILIMSLGITTLFAKSHKSGRLYPGQSVKVVPVEGYVFGITKSPKSHSKNANYTLRMKNYSDLIYEDRHQSDDVYLSFTDGVEQGDAIYIKVHKGIFDYGLKKFDSIPQVVQDVLEEDSVEADVTDYGNTNNSVETIQFTEELPTQQIQRHFNFNSEPKPAVETVVEKSYTNSPNVQENEIKTETENSKGFFSTISDAFVNFFNSFKSETKSKDSISSMGRGIENLQSIENNKIESQSIKKPTLLKEEKKVEELPAFDDSNLRKVSRAKDISFNDNIKAPSLELSSEPTSITTYEVPQMREHISTPPTVTTPKVTKRIPPKMQERVPENVNSNSVTKVVKSDCVVAPVTTYPNELNELSKSRTVSSPVVDTGYIDNSFDTGYKESYKDLNPTPAPVAVVKEQIKEPIVEKIEKPKKRLKPEVVEEENSNSKKIVITKIIDSQNPSINEEPMERMSDRVLGGSYAGSSGGKLGVKVYKNSRPIAAWIEVYKSNSKKRVKTFYTSRGSNIKTVKLPAGQYDIKATYRAKSIKQKKFLNNINIEDGERVDKSLSFNDGTLEVIAKRGDEPLYVKVTAYKNSNGKKVTYDFSSRRTGIATLTLPVGTYEIEVKEHLDVRKFIVKIRAGKKKVINADF